ncbi:uncharacterized protein LOC132032365 [Lycium ferocissimum]|uniref:uncharacterized protein LOC132032365 n=1 Tax=Lycium ferocissimum TaxID=112874 RepID=UPI00281523F8|nr:uncharacterized protein LOC132032365 [Lycium ferocissimum]
MCTVGFAYEYPTSNEYKLVVVENFCGEDPYIFHIFSSDVGIWQEFQWTTSFGDYVNFQSRSFYLNHTLYWLMKDGRVLAFDTNQKYARILKSSLEVIKQHVDLPGDKIFHHDSWFGVVQGKLHLVWALKNYVVVVTYDDEINSWEVVHINNNFLTGLTSDCYRYGRPLWINNNKWTLLFLLVHPFSKDGTIYEYDFETRQNRKIIDVPVMKNPRSQIFVPLVPTLAKVKKTHLDSLSNITEITKALDKLKQLFNLDN